MNWGIFTDIVEYYKNAVGEGITPLMFLQTCGMLIIFFTIRYIIFLKMENIPILNAKKEKDIAKKSYLLGHLTLELLLAFALSYSLLVLRGSQTHNYVWNMAVAPGFGMFISVMIDLKFLMKDEANAPMSLSINKFSNYGKSGDKVVAGPSNNLAPSINVQVNTGDGNVESGLKNQNKEMVNSEIKPLNHLDLDVESENFNSEILKSINNIIDVQISFDSKIDDMNEKTDDIQNIIKNLQEVEMRKHQITLKNMMYLCLDKGFATPRENDEIETSYYNYTKLLNGNGEIKRLFEKHYSLLEIHEDRRFKQEAFPGKDKRTNEYKYD